MAATNSAHVAEFRSFDLLFARSEEAQVPRDLLLLDMAPAAREAIVAIREAIASSGARLDAEIDALLTERNWRPQLVGCVALVVAGPNESRLASLWGAINRPCWTSPQLVASASLVDEHFDERARARLDRRGGLDVREAVAMPWLLRHLALGPQSIEAHWAEVVAALLRMYERGDRDCDVRGDRRTPEARGYRHGQGRRHRRGLGWRACSSLRRYRSS